MSYFNKDQCEWMEHLSQLSPEEKCECGWELKGKCYNCNIKKFKAKGGTIRSTESYFTPEGKQLDYSTMLLWLDLP